MSQLARSASFEYLWHRSTDIRNTFALAESDVYRRQILTTKVGPRTVRASEKQKVTLMVNIKIYYIILILLITGNAILSDYFYNRNHFRCVNTLLVFPCFFNR